jgi:hypothetical protein
MLNLNDDSIKSEGGSSFDPSKIFGMSVVENNVITDTVENVIIGGFDKGTTSTGNAYWDIQLQDSNGNTYNLREFDIDTTREGWEKKQTSQLKRLKHVLSKFVPEGTALPQAATFPELWEGVQKLLVGNQANTKPIRLKMIFNNKGYLSTPAYVPYMELMSVPKEQSRLKLDSSFDTLERPQADKPTEAPAASSTEDVPFSFG